MSKTIIAASLATFIAATMPALFVTGAVAQMSAGNPVPVSYTHLTLPTNREV